MTGGMEVLQLARWKTLSVPDIGQVVENANFAAQGWLRGNLIPQSAQEPAAGEIRSFLQRTCAAARDCRLPPRHVVLQDTVCAR